MSNTSMASFIEEHPAAATLIEAMRTGWEAYYASHAGLLGYAMQHLPGDGAQVIADTAAASVKYAAANELITVEELHARLVNVLEPVIAVLANIPSTKPEEKVADAQ